MSIFDTAKKVASKLKKALTFDEITSYFGEYSEDFRSGIEGVLAMQGGLKPYRAILFEEPISMKEKPAIANAISLAFNDLRRSEDYRDFAVVTTSTDIEGGGEATIFILAAREPEKMPSIFPSGKVVSEIDKLRKELIGRKNNYGYADLNENTWEMVSFQIPGTKKMTDGALLKLPESSRTEAITGFLRMTMEAQGLSDQYFITPQGLAITGKALDVLGENEVKCGSPQYERN